MHFVSVGQQNEDGKPVPHCWRLDFPPHIGSCLEAMCDACAEAETDAVRKNRKDILDRRGKTEDRVIVVCGLKD